MTKTADEDGVTASGGASARGGGAAPAPTAPAVKAAGQGAATPRRRRGVAAAALLVAGVAVALVVARAGASRDVPAARPSTAAPRPPSRGAVALPAGAAQNNVIETAVVRRTRLAGDLHVIGNVSYGADQVAIVGPLVPGRVARLGAGLGTHVERGQVLAEIESADVGEARAALIAASARFSEIGRASCRERV